LSDQLKIRIFAHSWVSDWNHGNAHFLRGLACELGNLGHEVCCYEQVNSWSITSLLQEGPDRAAQALSKFHQAFPTLDVCFLPNDATLAHVLEQELREADLVLVHEWNPLELIVAILDLKDKFGFRTLFHDTHHRAYTSPQEIDRLPLDRFDGVLAFGDAIRRIYMEVFGIKRAWSFHEAADVAHFHPLPLEKDTDVVWIGNWGDDERTRELQEFLIDPATTLHGHTFVVHGVRYPVQARTELQQAGIEYRGYVSNLEAPAVYGRSLLSLHVPRRFYTNGLSGIPTIRVFEALACGTPLVCSPWSDREGLFRPGEDYVCVKNGRAMAGEISHLLCDEKARQQLAAAGLETIRKRHTCKHRAHQLLEHWGEIA
jgi:spore maturation protein CgeB